MVHRKTSWKPMLFFFARQYAKRCVFTFELSVQKKACATSCVALHVCVASDNGVSTLSRERLKNRVRPWRNVMLSYPGSSRACPCLAHGAYCYNCYTLTFDSMQGTPKFIGCVLQGKGTFILVARWKLTLVRGNQHHFVEINKKEFSDHPITEAEIDWYPFFCVHRFWNSEVFVHTMCNSNCLFMFPAIHSKLTLWR